MITSDRLKEIEYIASQDEIYELVAEIRRLREVLKFYSNEEHYLMIDTVYEDQGQRARDAIGGKNVI